MSRTNTRSEGHPWRAAKRASKRDGGRRGDDSAAAPPQSPLDFALAIMRDPSAPLAHRVAMTKVAMPYLHDRHRAEAPPPQKESEPLSDLELARRVAYILTRADKARERETQRAAAPPRPLVPPHETHVGSTRPAREAGGMRHAPTPTPARSPSSGRASHGPVGAEEEERPIAPRDDPFDPHPGYRWI
jgi:hypothetical protein